MGGTELQRSSGRHQAVQSTAPLSGPGPWHFVLLADVGDACVTPQVGDELSLGIE